MQTSSPTPRTRAIINHLLSAKQLQLTHGRARAPVRGAEVGAERRARNARPCPCGSGSPFVLCHGPRGVPHVAVLALPRWARGAAWEGGPEWVPVDTHLEADAAAELLLPDGTTLEVVKDRADWRVRVTSPGHACMHYWGRMEAHARREVVGIIRRWHEGLA